MHIYQSPKCAIQLRIVDLNVVYLRFGKASNNESMCEIRVFEMFF